MSSESTDTESRPRAVPAAAPRRRPWRLWLLLALLAAILLVAIVALATQSNAGTPATGPGAPPAGGAPPAAPAAAPPAVPAAGAPAAGAPAAGAPAAGAPAAPPVDGQASPAAPAPPPGADGSAGGAGAPPGGDVVALRAGINQIMADTPLMFAANRATLTRSGTTALDRVAQELVAQPGAKVVVTGYTAPVVTAAMLDPQKLSEQRAVTVAERLTRDGVSPDRIQTRGAADMNPLPSPSASRRAEIAVS